MDQAHTLLKVLCETFECLRCSSFYTNPEQSDCGHNYCRDCWRNNDLECLMCEQTVLQRHLRPNVVLQQRAEHVKELYKAFQQLHEEGKETTSKRNSGTVAQKSRSTIEKEIFPNVPSVQNTYVNRRKKRNLSDDFDDLQSASHTDFTLLLPGENVSALYESKLNISKNTRKNSDYRANVQNWLQSEDNEFSEDSKTINMPNPKKSCPKVEEKSTPCIGSNEEKAKTTSNRFNQDDWDKIEILDSADDVEPKEKGDRKHSSLECFDHYVVEPRRSLRSKKVETEMKKKIPNSGVNVVVAEVETHIEKDKSMPPLKRDSSEKDIVTRQSWNNVKKMKKEFSKLKKPNVKKLNISIEPCRKTESVISKVWAEPDRLRNTETPITIEDNSTPAHSIPSTRTPSPCYKDKNAYEEVLRLSKLDNSPPEKLSPIHDMNVSIISDPPLTRFSTPDANFNTYNKLKARIGQYEKETQIENVLQHTGIFVGKSGNKVFSSVKALQREVIDQNRDVLNNSSIVDTSKNLSQCNKNLIKSPEKQQTENTAPMAIEISETKEDGSDWVMSQAVTGIKKHSVPASIKSGPFLNVKFLKLGKLSERSLLPSRHIPFYYKGDCDGKKINQADNEVVIRIDGNNVSTSIKVIAKPESVNIVTLNKAVQTEPNHTNDSKIQQIQVLPQNIDKGIQCSLRIRFEKEQSTVTEKNHNSMINEQIHSNFKLPTVASSLTQKVSTTTDSMENCPITEKTSTIGITNSCGLHKNTDSADTVTAGPLDKITASDEQAISEHMDCLDEDIFNSGSVVLEGQNIGIPKKQPSEIMFCTTRTQSINKKTQNRKPQNSDVKNIRQASKRIGNTEENSEQPKKKMRLGTEHKVTACPTEDSQLDNDLVITFQSSKEMSHHSQSLLKSQLRTDSEPMNYDEIIGDVFASIDADIKKKGNSTVKDGINLQVKENNQNITNIEPPATKRQSVESLKYKQKSDLLCVKKASLDIDNIKETNDLAHTEAAIEPNMESVVENKLYSENMFSAYEKTQAAQQYTDDIAEPLQASMDNMTGLTMQENLANLLTPQVCEELEQPSSAVAWQTPACMQRVSQLATPKQRERDEDSEGSVVDETPQKNRKSAQISLNRDSKVRKLSSVGSRSSVNSHNVKTSSIGEEERKVCDVQNDVPKKKNPLTENDIQNFIDITNEPSDEESHRNDESNKGITENVRIADKKSLETPLTINRFTDEVKYKSTPMQRIVRKSLNFSKNPEVSHVDLSHVSDKEMTSNISAKSTFYIKGTLENEFMERAFEKTPRAPAREKEKAIARAATSKQICVGCSCLLPAQVKNVKVLATRRNWTYVDSYTDNLTHLIVGVSDANISQRSVKYMCALAAGKWIVSYAWVVQCLKEDQRVEESPYEALDNTGANGPQLSRISNKKLFQGITFYCLPPFSILSEDVLSNILKSSGGRVVKNIEDVSVKNTSEVAIFLAEPENTQEDRFIDIAVNHNVVPVNFEWVLNCLGCYSVLSVKSLLLCPESLPHIAALIWPQHFLETTSDDEQ